MEQPRLFFTSCVALRYAHCWNDFEELCSSCRKQAVSLLWTPEGKRVLVRIIAVRIPTRQNISQIRQKMPCLGLKPSLIFFAKNPKIPVSLPVFSCLATNSQHLQDVLPEFYVLSQKSIIFPERWHLQHPLEKSSDLQNALPEMSPKKSCVVSPESCFNANRIFLI